MEWGLFVSSLLFFFSVSSQTYTKQVFFPRVPITLNKQYNYFLSPLLCWEWLFRVSKNQCLCWTDWKHTQFGDGCNMASICVWRLVITTLWKPWNLFFWCEPVWTDFEESDCKRPSGVCKKRGTDWRKERQHQRKKEREKKEREKSFVESGRNLLDKSSPQSRDRHKDLEAFESFLYFISHFELCNVELAWTPPFLWGPGTPPHAFYEHTCGDVKVEVVHSSGLYGA